MTTWKLPASCCEKTPRRGRLASIFSKPLVHTPDLPYAPLQPQHISVLVTVGAGIDACCTSASANLADAAIVGATRSR
jgi:hypothetical protein